MSNSSKDKKISMLNSLYDDGMLSHDEYQNKLQLINEMHKTNATTKIVPNTDNVNPAIVIKNLTKKYKKRDQPAVSDISFNVYPGQFHAFIGANGAGKTTTIKSIIGAYSKYGMGGEILINGFSNQTVEAKSFIGYIPENAIFPKKIKAREYLILMIMMSGYTKQDALKLVDELLKKINMLEFANKRPSSFSSGQKKKMLLAQALIQNPMILIMDEPAANLDPLARQELFDILVDLQKEGRAIFLSSHILDEIGKYATYATILDGGKIVFDGSLANVNDLSELYRRHVKLGSVDNISTSGSK